MTWSVYQPHRPLGCVDQQVLQQLPAGDQQVSQERCCDLGLGDPIAPASGQNGSELAQLPIDVGRHLCGAFSLAGASHLPILLAISTAADAPLSADNVSSDVRTAIAKAGFDLRIARPLRWASRRAVGSCQGQNQCQRGNTGKMLSE